jgi:hypothetical protein
MVSYSGRSRDAESGNDSDTCAAGTPLGAFHNASLGRLSMLVN